jgi:hypothetical protein
VDDAHVEELLYTQPGHDIEPMVDGGSDAARDTVDAVGVDGASTAVNVTAAAAAHEEKLTTGAPALALMAGDLSVIEIQLSQQPFQLVDPTLPPTPLPTPLPAPTPHGYSQEVAPTQLDDPRTPSRDANDLSVDTNHIRGGCGADSAVTSPGDNTTLSLTTTQTNSSLMATQPLGDANDGPIDVSTVNEVTFNPQPRRRKERGLEAKCAPLILPSDLSVIAPQLSQDSFVANGYSQDAVDLSVDAVESTEDTESLPQYEHHAHNLSTVATQPLDDASTADVSMAGEVTFNARQADGPWQQEDSGEVDEQFWRQPRAGPRGIQDKVQPAAAGEEDTDGENLNPQLGEDTKRVMVGRRCKGSGVTTVAQKGKQVKPTRGEGKKAGYVFLLSGSEEEQAAAEESILSLGGQVVGSSSSRTYDPACTHLLFEGLKRTEKVACGLAAGKWILHSSYLEDSFAAGHFLAEEPYEWGSGNIGHTGASNAKSRVWEGSARHWREQREQHGRGPFSGWRVSLYATAKHKMVPPIDLCHRLLEAGGATMISTRPPYNMPKDGGDGSENETRVAIIAEGLGASKQALKFKKARVQCIKPTYLIESVAGCEVLMQDHALDV